MSFHAFIVWLHLLGVVIWVGGAAFLTLTLTPALQRAASVRESLRLGLYIERRCRAVMWPAVGIVLLTGLFNVMNMLYAASVSGVSLPPAFVRLLALKIGLAGLMVVLQAVEQLVTHRRRIEGLTTLPRDATALPAPLRRWQRLSQRLGVATMILAAAAIALGVMLSR